MKLLYSMTGYAEVSVAVAGAQPPLAVRLELRSVNSRFLDLMFRLPDELRASEASVRVLLTQQLRRGKVECRINLDEAQSAQALPDLQQIEPLLQAEAVLLKRAPHLRSLSVADVWRLSAAQQLQPHADPAMLTQAMQRAAEAALIALQAARSAEGERLRSFLLDRCAQLQQWALAAEQVAPQAVARLQERFMTRWNEALQALGGSPDPEAVRDRLLQETTAFALRVDVAEEISRLQSHLDAIRKVLDEGGEVGKRLDFLIQELHREANTLGSKSAVLELSELAVHMKVCIEQMREQVQNLE
ncbi:YicC/YloC family endoribonuclease [Thiomonas sp. X19]|uniref:YicC/YloC family endoribonuclease n=1 Tax=Thiomonas sp. X19 TaxID=1050370 RepID=UPI00352A3554